MVGYELRHFLGGEIIVFTTTEAWSIVFFFTGRAVLIQGSVHGWLAGEVASTTSVCYD